MSVNQNEVKSFCYSNVKLTVRKYCSTFPTRFLPSFQVTNTYDRQTDRQPTADSTHDNSINRYHTNV